MSEATQNSQQLKSWSLEILRVKYKKMKEAIIGSSSYLVGHQLQKVIALIPWDLQDYNNQKSKFVFWNHFLK
jgi:hypothetical protein